jgi:hypothetical protein
VNTPLDAGQLASQALGFDIRNSQAACGGVGVSARAKLVGPILQVDGNLLDDVDAPDWRHA